MPVGTAAEPNTDSDSTHLHKMRQCEHQPPLFHPSAMYSAYVAPVQYKVVQGLELSWRTYPPTYLAPLNVSSSLADGKGKKSRWT